MRPLRTAALFAAVVLVACGPPNQPPPGVLVKSDKARLTASAPQADLDAAVFDANALALDVFRKLPAAENSAYSPMSVQVALAMTSAGAAGTTKDAFTTLLHPSLPDDRFHRAMNTLDAALASRGQGASGKDGRPFALRQNNQLFSQLNQHLEAPFLDTLAQEYGAGVRQLDFATKAEDSRQAINGWVKTNTENLIPELLAKGDITADTRLALVNTLYFNAGWKTKFDHSATQPLTFTKDDGSTKQVPTMLGESVVTASAVVDGTDVVEVPYSGDEVSMVFIAPPQGKLASFEHDFSAQKLKQLTDALVPGSGSLSVPKFEAKSRVDLSAVLSALGLAVAFSGDADFSAMTGAKGLAIQAVVHQAVVKTDEDGTEAAAATAVVVGKMSAVQAIELHRPFIYVIRDRATGAVLFLGHIVDP
jgi:serpin B